jgi:hypothetical protein
VDVNRPPSILGRETGVEIAPFRSDDEEDVLQLLRAALGAGPGGSRTAEFFRWKHLSNPFGASLMLLARADARIVGLRAFMRWRFTTKEREFAAVRAVDTATHPDYQSRGIFSELTLAAIDSRRGDVDLVFNTPNEKSLPGYLKMGWIPAGSVPIRLRVRRPAHFVRGVRSLRGDGGTAVARPLDVRAPLAADVLDRRDVPALLEASETFPGRLATRRTVEYLRWRYGAAPLLDYRAFATDEGIAIFRVRPRGSLWESTVSELIVSEGDVRAARRLLAGVRRAADVDHIALTFPKAATAARAVRVTSVKAPRGMKLVVNPLVDVRPDPTRLDSWALSLGDLEVF